MLDETRRQHVGVGESHLVNEVDPNIRTTAARFLDRGNVAF